MSDLIESADRWTAEVRRAVAEIGPVSSYCAAEALYWLCGGANLRFFLKRSKRSGKDRWWVGAEGSPDWVADPLGDAGPSVYASGRRAKPLWRIPGSRTTKIVRMAAEPAMAGAIGLAKVAFPAHQHVVADVELYGTSGIVVRLKDVQRARRGRKTVAMAFQMASSGTHDGMDGAIEAVMDQLGKMISRDVLES